MFLKSLTSVTYIGLIACLIVLSGCSKENAIEKYIGKYDVFEECNNTLDWTYMIEITEVETGDGDIVISNFGDFSKNVVAEVADDKISYNYEEAQFSISGTGEISGNSLTLYYTSTEYHPTGEVEFSSSCIAYCTKQ